MTNLQKIVEEIFTPEELALIDSGEYKPGRAVLDAKIDLAIAVEREACAKVCDERERANLYGFKECAAAIRARGET